MNVRALPFHIRNDSVWCADRHKCAALQPDASRRAGYTKSSIAAARDDYMRAVSLLAQYVSNVVRYAAVLE